MIGLMADRSHEFPDSRSHGVYLRVFAVRKCFYGCIETPVNHWTFPPIRNISVPW